MTPLPEMTESDIARYWAKVDVRGPDECWPWTAGTNVAGYGCFGKDRKSILAHRISLAIDGRDPSGAIARHRCDNPPCCNPAHLETGTHADNARDREERGRGNQVSGDRSGSRTKPERLARGERVNTAKLTAADIPVIRADPRSLRAIAADYGVTFAMVGFIKRRTSWAHVA